MENMRKSYFPIGGGIFLRLGAPVKSKCDGLKSRKTWCSYISNFWKPWEPLFVNLNIPKYFHKFKKKNRFDKSWNWKFWNPGTVESWKLETLKTCNLWILKVSKPWNIQTFKMDGLNRLINIIFCSFVLLSADSWPFRLIHRISNSFLALRLRGHLGLVQGWESECWACWGFPDSKIQKLPNFHFMLFDRYQIHIQDFEDFVWDLHHFPMPIYTKNDDL